MGGINARGTQFIDIILSVIRSLSVVDIRAGLQLQPHLSTGHMYIVHYIEKLVEANDV